MLWLHIIMVGNISGKLAFSYGQLDAENILYLNNRVEINLNLAFYNNQLEAKDVI